MLPLQILDGRYRLEEVLGVGGMSVVWRATDDVLGRAVAVKILAGDLAYNPDARAAGLAEAQAVAQLSHPNICTVFDYGESLQPDGRMVPYVVMELLTGPSLAERLEERPLAPHEALKVAAEVAAGLAAAHAHGVVHQDVKPGNVILTPSGAKVFDFGIAAIAGAPDLAGPDGRILATPSYVAPERLMGGTVLPASDMFGWGVLLFRLLTGKLPWPSWAGLADRLSAVAPLPDIPGVPGKIGELYWNCIAADPDDRPTAASAAAVLRVALMVRTPQPGDVAPRGGLPDADTESVILGAMAAAERRRRRRRAVLLAAGLVVVLAAGAFAFSNSGGKAQGGGVTPSQTTAPAGEGFAGSAPPGGPTPSPTKAPPRDVPVGPPIPANEAPVRGIPGPTVTVTVPGGNPPVVGPAMRFNTKGGHVVVVCDTYGPRLVSLVAKPGFYSDFISLVIVAFGLFIKPAAGANPSLKYQLTITCPGGVPKATIATITGPQPLPPSPAPPTTPASATPSP